MHHLLSRSVQTKPVPLPTLRDDYIPCPWVRVNVDRPYSQSIEGNWPAAPEASLQDAGFGRDARAGEPSERRAQTTIILLLFQVITCYN